MIITSPHNPRVKQAIALRDRRERDQSGLIRVEGFEMIALTSASGAHPITLFFCPDLFREAGQAALLDQIRESGSEIIEVPQRVFDKLAYRDNPDGWLAIIPNPMRRLAELPLRTPPFVVVAEAVEKPGNLGAILRTADAAGVDAVISSA